MPQLTDQGLIGSAIVKAGYSIVRESSHILFLQIIVRDTIVVGEQ
jgi:hypothetical protein